MNKPDLILVGFGGFGREVAAWITSSEMPFRVAGHLDDENSDPRVLGPIATHAPRKGSKYLTCFGEGQSRQAIRIKMEKLGAQFATLIDPRANFSSPLEQSLNSIFLGVCSISSSVALGNDVLIQGFACIGHDVVIGDGVTVSSHAFIGGHAKLGAFSTIHPHAVILPSVVVGEGASVGAGAVVIKNVPPNTTVFGSPAKVIAYGKPDA